MVSAETLAAVNVRAIELYMYIDKKGQRPAFNYLELNQINYSDITQFKEDKNSIPQCIGQSHITTAFSNMAPFRSLTRVRQRCARCAVKTIKL